MHKRTSYLITFLLLFKCFSTNAQGQTLQDVTREGKISQRDGENIIFKDSTNNAKNYLSWHDVNGVARAKIGYVNETNRNLYIDNAGLGGIFLQNRTLVNNPVDDGSTAFQVNGDIRSSNGVFRALSGPVYNDILMNYGYNPGVGDYTSIKVAGLAPNSAELRLIQNGNVGIGTLNPQSKLAVNGTITATKVKVTQTDWSDFVFEPAYKLPPLREVEIFIKKNKHLPDIPPEAEVKKEGIDVGMVQAKLLQKIEELTLYLIDLNKTVEDQQKLIIKLNKELKAIKADKTL